MARRSSSRRRANYEWAGTQFVASALSTTQTILATLTPGEQGTLIRSRGNILIVATPDAADDDDVVGLGLIVVSSEAAAIGGTSIPGPINNEDAPWLWHTFVPIMNVAVTAASDTALGLIHRVTLDSKAMRRLNTNDRVVLVAELGTGEFAAVRALGGMRNLLLQN